MINVGKKMRAISALFVELVGGAGFEPATPSSRTGQRGVRVEAKSLFRFKASVSTRTLRKYLIQPNMGHLPGPPRIHGRTEISRTGSERPRLAALRESGRSPRSIIQAGGRFCPLLSLLTKSGLAMYWVLNSTTTTVVLPSA